MSEASEWAKNALAEYAKTAGYGKHDALLVMKGSLQELLDKLAAANRKLETARDTLTQIKDGGAFHGAQMTALNRMLQMCAIATDCLVALDGGGE